MDPDGCILLPGQDGDPDGFLADLVVDALAVEVQVAAGKLKQEPIRSPIVRAIQAAEAGTTGEIRVHLSRKFFESDPWKRATQLFSQYRMDQTRDRNGVLLYFNYRHRKFAVIADEGIHKQVGQSYWEDLIKALREDLQSTHLERAVALAVTTLGFTLKKYFPSHAPDLNEIPDEVTQD